MERGDSIDRGRCRYLGSLAPALLAALPCWQQGHKGMMKDTEGEMAPSAPRQLLPMFDVTRAQQGVRECSPIPLRVLVLLSLQWVIPIVLAHNPNSHSHQILRGFPQLPAVSRGWGSKRWLQARTGHNHCPGSTTLRTRSTGGVLGPGTLMLMGDVKLFASQSEGRERFRR